MFKWFLNVLNQFFNVPSLLCQPKLWLEPEHSFPFLIRQPPLNINNLIIKKIRISKLFHHENILRKISFQNLRLFHSFSVYALFMICSWFDVEASSKQNRQQINVSAYKIKENDKCSTSLVIKDHLVWITRYHISGITLAQVFQKAMFMYLKVQN